MELVKDQAKPGDTPAATTAPEQCPQCRGVDNPQHLCLGKRLSQLPHGNHSGQVEERALHGGAGDSIDHSSVAGPQTSIAMRRYSLRTAAAPMCGSHVNRVASIGTNPP